MRIAPSLLLSLAVASLLRGQQSGPALGEAASQTLAHTFATADTWSLQAMALFSLGTDWHPAASDALAAALASKDLRLCAFAIEQLRRTNARVLGSVCTTAVIDALVEKHAISKHALLQRRALEVLVRVFPDLDPKKPMLLAPWWREKRPTYAPSPWSPMERDGDQGGTVAGGIMDKAMDLREAGLQVAFVVDSTGSMQAAIDAVRDAIAEITAILAGIAPKLELGLVHYKDFGDMVDLGKAAEILVPLSKNTKTVRDRLAKLRASGGGDIPERVEKGIECALGKDMGWDEDKNRMLLVVGDAPPHAETQAALLAMVKNAYEKPFEDEKRPTTGKKKKLRPFVTSTIATHKDANPWFQDIADAGGGTMVRLDLGGPVGLLRGGKAGDQETAPELIAKHVLRLSFGAQWKDQIDVFVGTFFDYRRAGVF